MCNQIHLHLDLLLESTKREAESVVCQGLPLIGIYEPAKFLRVPRPARAPSVLRPCECEVRCISKSYMYFTSVGSIGIHKYEQFAPYNHIATNHAHTKPLRHAQSGTGVSCTLQQQQLAPEKQQLALQFPVSVNPPPDDPE